MSAVAGIFRLDGQRVVEGVLSRVIETMPHRASDGTGVWASGPVGLAHGMFHTTPESLHEVQPLMNAVGTIALTADARIDNRDELIDALGIEKEAGRITDSELILAAYEVWGEGCLERLIGDFAFAIWDQSKQRLLCARDHFGVKPFYYHYDPECFFVFGTEIKALLAGGVPERLNELRIGDHLCGMREDAESTICEDVWSLPAAHALVVDAEGLRVWRYYELAPAEDIPQDASDAWYEARFRELFTEAVRCRVRSAFPVGSQLSGGLDSSAVTCVARDVLRDEGRSLHTFSLMFEASVECDERSYVEPVLRQGGTIPHFVSGDDIGPLSNLDEAYEVLDEGLLAGTQHLVWALLRAARDEGTRVVLDGVDGDNVVSHGSLYFKELAEAGDWAGFSRETSALAKRHAEADHLHPFEQDLGSQSKMFSAFAAPALQRRAERGPWWRFLRDVEQVSRYFGLSRRYLLGFYWNRMIRPYFLLRLSRSWRARSKPPISPPSLPEIVSSDFAERIGLADRLAQFPSMESQGLFGISVRETQRHLLSSARLEYVLGLTDHVGAMLSVEVRHPFLDKRLVEFCLALPSDQSLRDGWTRRILRRALAHTLPKEVAWRVGKAWMTPSFERGLFEIDGERLRAFVESPGALKAYINKEVLDEWYREGTSLSEEKQAMLQKLFALSCWLAKRTTRRTVQPGLSEERFA